MKISLVPNLNRQDFPSAPDWISTLLYPIQLFFNTVTATLQNNLTLQDNSSCVIQQFILTAGATDLLNTYQFKCNLGRQPIEFNYFCTRTDGVYDVIYPQISWNFINGNIVINGIKGLISGVKYNITITVK